MSALASRWCALLLVLCLTAPLTGAGQTTNGLDCWVPTREQRSGEGRLNVASPQMASMRRAILAAEDVVRRNAHFRAMPRPIRIRSTITASDGTPRTARLNTNAYQPEVWAEGTCDVVPGADRCCRDGMIVITLNDRTPTLRTVMKDGVAEFFEEPVLTGKVGGYPEYDGAEILISTGNRVPWTAVTVAEYLDFEERRLTAERAAAVANISQPGLDPAQVQSAYESMRKIDAKAADEFLARAKKTMADAPAQQQKLRTSAGAYFEQELATLASLRALLSTAELQRQAGVGDGPLQLARFDDPRAKKLVKADSSFWDSTDPDRVQLVRVRVGVVAADPVVERRETMRRTKETLDYAALAALLR